MTAKYVIVWRHGQTDWNVAGRYQGQEDIALNAVGLAQAQAAARVLADYQPDLIVASDLQRAHTTAQQLAELVGREVVTDERLREVHIGSWVGLTSEEVFPIDPMYQRSLVEGFDWRRSESGETAMEVGERVAAALADIGGSAPDGSTVVVGTHGLAARMGIACLLGLSYEQSLLLAGPRNCSWAILQPSRLTTWRLLSYNNVARDHSERGESTDDQW
ncbi:MAG: histidine phosphatase family protein [Propionibacteriaceae bacterium]